MNEATRRSASLSDTGLACTLLGLDAEMIEVDVDLESGYPSSLPGAEDTPAYGFYNGGTEYDPLDPSTLEDDYILFRMRLSGNPGTGGGFTSSHWNILLDIDDDGYKEYWVDLEGSYQWSANLVDWYACDGLDGPATGETVSASPQVNAGTAEVTISPSASMSHLFVRVGVQVNGQGQD